MSQLCVEQRPHMAPRAEGPDFPFHAGFPGELGNQKIGNEVANLAQQIQFRRGWNGFVFLFHPCLVAGANKSFQLFSIFYGMAVVTFHETSQSSREKWQRQRCCEESPVNESKHVWRYLEAHAVNPVNAPQNWRASQGLVAVLMDRKALKGVEVITIFKASLRALRTEDWLNGSNMPGGVQSRPRFFVLRLAMGK